MTALHLTDRAISDIDTIMRYSVERWGLRVADQYLTDLEAALGRLASDLSLLKERPDYPGRLRFYRVRRHILVGDVIDGVGYVLTVWHGSMDFIDRLARLESGLMHEAELMARHIEAGRGD